MTIRPATPADIPQLVALNRVAQALHAAALPERFRADAPDAEVARAFQTALESPSACWLVAAPADGPLSGFLSAEFRAREASWCLVAHRVCYLSALVVAPRHQRRGTARALVAALRHAAAARGIADLELDVWTFNTPARQAFARLGFTPLMERLRLSTTQPSA